MSAHPTEELYTAIIGCDQNYENGVKSSKLKKDPVVKLHHLYGSVSPPLHKSFDDVFVSSQQTVKPYAEGLTPTQKITSQSCLLPADSSHTLPTQPHIDQTTTPHNLNESMKQQQQQFISFNEEQFTSMISALGGIEKTLKELTVQVQFLAERSYMLQNVCVPDRRHEISSTCYELQQQQPLVCDANHNDALTKQQQIHHTSAIPSPMVKSPSLTSEATIEQPSRGVSFLLPQPMSSTTQSKITSSTETFKKPLIFLNYDSEIIENQQAPPKSKATDKKECLLDQQRRLQLEQQAQNVMSSIINISSDPSKKKNTNCLFEDNDDESLFVRTHGRNPLFD